MIDWKADDSDKFIGTTAAIILGLSAAASGTAGAYAASKTSGAATDAANITAGAATNTAKLQSDSTAKALDFTKAQAETDWKNQELARKANYDLAATHQGKVNTLGAMFGFAPTNMPDYVPSQDPAYTSAAPGGATTPTAPGGATTPAPAGSDPTTTALLANYKALGVNPTGPGTGPTDLAYYAAQIAKTGGLTPSNSGYWLGPQGRIATDLAKATGGGSSATGAATTPSAYTTLGSMMPFQTAPTTGTLQMPRTVGQVLTA